MRPGIVVYRFPLRFVLAHLVILRLEHIRLWHLRPPLPPASSRTNKLRPTQPTVRHFGAERRWLVRDQRKFQDLQRAFRFVAAPLLLSTVCIPGFRALRSHCYARAATRRRQICQQ